ncbi:O-succinylbenzoic acid--CoA ligase [Actinomyces sp. HMSC075C01]|uniref:O-succinylbenzoic acid--CoA ligase n=1 Tax=Actinomyces oris TaxID=544580 RepID=A0A1Q8VTX7_9ACTO|nr:MULTISPECIES: AMP-binding protein [Actinomyces]OFR53331.1 O-succinylbenzoic acid--CoA ligase [Actinomyces sp. HMSC075C01]OLO51557.1 O-succinylbenzoic acid--CoA ligase [Actinomyces oris]
MLAPPALRLLTGGTAPDDVAALRAALAERLALRGLLTSPDGRPATAAVGEADRTGSRQPLLVPIAPGKDPAQVRADLARRITRVPARTDLILRTSGSTTGTGRLIAISATALMASARATHARLGGPGTWLLPLPAHHVAGLQILTRSLEAGTEPVVVDTSTGFSPTALAEALSSARPPTGAAASRLYVSLVPTQLVRVLQNPQARRALAEADAVLLGGAAADPALLARARGAGVTVVTTYGMSETGGGCVYNGRPLEGVEVTIHAPDAEGAGRILISGPVLAEDYLHTPGHSPADSPAGSPKAGEGFHRSGARRVLATSDRGRLHPDGRLEVLGRLDDVIITGGIKVEPRHVEEALTGIDGVAEACVVGLPDEQWGSRVVAAVVLEPVGQPGRSKRWDGAALREAVRARLDGAHAPKRVVVLETLPLRPSGKVDRREVARLLAATTTDVTSEPLTPEP